MGFPTMHPAKSVILFTTASGAGYGLLILFALMDLAGWIPTDMTVTLAGIGTAFVLISGGLLASTFHLGHPERAWRALSQWRTSWLSREGVMALLTFAPMAAYCAGRVYFPDLTEPWQPALGAVTAACAAVTVLCTAMIYASLKTVPAWSTAWTPVCYATIALSSGAVLICGLAVVFGFLNEGMMNAASILLLVGLASKLAYWRAVGRAAPRSTAESATGLGGLGRVKPLEPPHEGTNYLLDEMGFRVARRHAARLRRIALIWGFVFPMLGILFAGYSDGMAALGLIGLALVTGAVGLFAERYLFFAEAKHAVTLYYGELSV